MMVDSLTTREVEILRLIAGGLTNPEIAAELSLSTETVKWYNRQSFAKLGVSNRTQAVAAARERGLLDGHGEPRRRPVAYPWQHLPSELSTFVGRERETAEVLALLDKSRLVTLTGPGGVGKTRLAVHVAGKAATRYAHGVTFVSLAATMDPALVPATIASRLGVVEKPDKPLVELIRHFLSDKELLLVLDNFEHVMEAVPLVAELLTAGPRVNVLASSREVLRLSGEQEYAVPPLSLPDTRSALSPADLSTSEAVNLFVQRAGGVQHTFQLTVGNAPDVAAICLRLDGLPLAIELAAARIKLFSPQQLLKRLARRLGALAAGPRDLPARQRTLRDTIEWSYNLLEDEEQQLFARLAVFIDGRSIEAIETVCDSALAIDTLDGLASLLNKSLIYQEKGPGGQSRFYMLEIIQEYAGERLAASGEMQQVRSRHLDYFLSLAETMASGYRRHNQLLLLEQTKAEMGNIRAAIKWAMAHNRVEAAVRLAAALNGIGELRRANGDFDGARAVYEESLSLAFETGEIYRQSMARANLAMTSYRLGAYEEAKTYGLEYLRQRYENGMHLWYSCCVAVLAGPEWRLGSPERAARLLGASEAMLETIKFSYQPADQSEVDLYTAEVKAVLGQEAFEKHWAEGKQMTIDETFAYALGE